MKLRTLLAPFCLLGFAGALSLQAQTIVVVNGDFETDGLLTDSYSNFPGVIPTGWQAVGSGISGNYFGYLNPDDDSYVGTTGNLSAPGMSGPNVFYFGTAVQGEGIEQTLASTFDVGASYDLTVAVGSRVANYNATAGLIVNLYAGNTLLATGSFRNTAFDGTFTDFNVHYDFSPTHANALGQQLRIQFLEDDSLSVGELDIDNVRLTAMAIPEPSTYALLSVGAGFLGLMWWRRRRATS